MVAAEDRRPIGPGESEAMLSEQEEFVMLKMVLAAGVMAPPQGEAPPSPTTVSRRPRRLLGPRGRGVSREKDGRRL
jgi:hypothetical protein